MRPPKFCLIWLCGYWGDDKNSKLFQCQWMDERCHRCESLSCSTLCDKVCQWLAAGQWFSPDTPVSSTKKTDRHDITEILLKVALNITTLTLYLYVRFGNYMASFVHPFSFLGGGNRSIRRKPLTCRKSLTNFIT
jgi:hypothetical protein